MPPRKTVSPLPVVSQVSYGPVPNPRLQRVQALQSLCLLKCFLFTHITEPSTTTAPHMLLRSTWVRQGGVGLSYHSAWSHDWKKFTESNPPWRKFAECNAKKFTGTRRASSWSETCSVIYLSVTYHQIEKVLFSSVFPKRPNAVTSLLPGSGHSWKYRTLIFGCNCFEWTVAIISILKNLKTESLHLEFIKHTEQGQFEELFTFFLIFDVIIIWSNSHHIVLRNIL